MALTKTQKRDMRDNASLGISLGSLMVGIAGLALALNKKPDEDGEVVYSEKLGKVRRRDRKPHHDETRRESPGFLQYLCTINQPDAGRCQGRSPTRGFRTLRVGLRSPEEVDRSCSPIATLALPVLLLVELLR